MVVGGGGPPRGLGGLVERENGDTDDMQKWTW